VAQVLSALAAQQLYAVAPVGIQGLVRNMVPYLLPKAGEAGADIELPADFKQGVAAAGAGIGTALLRVCCRVYLFVPDQVT
jgi:hypothetical protein